jgi:hypothetical protein
MIVLGSSRTLSGTTLTVVTAAESSGMPGETHQVGYGGDSVSASFQASRARCDVEASPDATLEDRDIGGDMAVHRSRAAGEESCERGPWFEIDPRLTDLVMAAAMSKAANFDAGGLGGL